MQRGGEALMSLRSVDDVDGEGGNSFAGAMVGSVSASFIAGYASAVNARLVSLFAAASGSLRGAYEAVPLGLHNTEIYGGLTADRSAISAAHAAADGALTDLADGFDRLSDRLTTNGLLAQSDGAAHASHGDRTSAPNGAGLGALAQATALSVRADVEHAGHQGAPQPIGADAPARSVVFTLATFEDVNGEQNVVVTTPNQAAPPATSIYDGTGNFVTGMPSDASPLLTGDKWGPAAFGTGGTVTFSFPTNFTVNTGDPATGVGGYGYSGEPNSGGEQLTAVQRDAARLALQRWGSVVNLNFQEIFDGPDTSSSGDNSSVGDIRFGLTDAVDTAQAYFPGPWAEAGDVWIGKIYHSNPVPGNYAYLTFLHEIGHAIGLDHPHEVAWWTHLDSIKYTVMSYRDFIGDNLDGYESSFFPTTPMLYDIWSIQQLYGANASSNPFTQTYMWEANQSIYECIWDTGGFDTINASNQQQGVDLRLTPGEYSSIGVPFFNGQATVRDGLVIAFGTVIENAVGSAFADTLTGNSADNILRGGGGNDILDGGDGIDTAEYFELQASYAIVLSGSDILITRSGDGTDTVRSTVERFSFAGAVVTRDELLGDVPEFTEGADNAALPARAGTYDALGGDDVIGYTGGFVTVNGGAGSDLVDFSVFGNGVWVSLVQDGIEGWTRDTQGVFIGDWRPIAELANVEHLVGTEYSDFLQGNGGDNILFYTDGFDALDGQGGSDTVDFSRFDSAIWVSLSYGGRETWTRDTANLNFGQWSEIADLAGIEHVVATDYADGLYGDANNNLLHGAAGDDVLAGGDGNDTLDGGAGVDTAVFAHHRDSYEVSLNGTDVFLSGPGDGTDTVRNTVERFTFANLTLTRAQLLDQLSQGFTEGADVITLPNRAATYDALGGDDVVRYTGGLVTIDGGTGTDLIDFSGFGSAVWVSLDYAGREAWTRGTGNLDTGVWREIADIARIEHVIGTSGADGLVGDGNDNQLDGAAGDDVLTGRGGNDTLEGGAGNDTASFGNRSDSYTISVNGADLLVTGTGEGTDTVRNTVERFAFSDITLTRAQLIDLSLGPQFTGGADAVTLPARAGTYDALGGDDLLRYSGGLVSINGGAGVDLVDFSAFGAAVWANLAQTTNTASTVDRPDLTGGTSRVIANLSAVENLAGTAFSDNISGNGGSNVIFYTGGLDVLDGQGGSDTVDFSRFASAVWVKLEYTGREVWTRDSANLDVGAWREIADLAGFEHVVGTSAADGLHGDGNDNRLDGAAGDDVLAGNGGNDSLDGGAGTDTAVFSNHRSSYTVTQSGTDILISGAGEGTDTIRDTVERFAFSNATLTRAQLLNGDIDVPGGTGGANVIVYTGGFVSITGTAGVDTLDFSAFGAAVWVSLTQNGIEGWTRDQATMDTGAWRPIAEVANVENLVGTAFSDYLQGNSGSNVLFYTGGLDVLDGLGGVDTADFSRFGSAVWVSLGYGGREAWTRGTTSLDAGTWREIADLAGIENVRGTDRADGLYGDGNANLLDGAAGDDVLSGGGGSDTLEGGAGTDTAVYTNEIETYLFDVDGTDILILEQDGAIDRIRDTVERFTFNDFTMTRTEIVDALQAAGDAGSDSLFITWVDLDHTDPTIVGGSGADSLSGGVYNDSIAGLGGADTLTGGGGSDVFRFDSPSDGLDIISDFTSFDISLADGDRVLISASGFGGGLEADGPVDLVSAASVLDASNAGTDGYLIFDNAGADAGTVYWDATGGDSADATAFVILQGATTLQPIDFQVV
jgi:serralysin